LLYPAGRTERRAAGNLIRITYLSPPSKVHFRGTFLRIQ
jgi:hypothetical protein